ncbi:MAG TPA: V-type ATP synthase subunit I [Firmicutes bacterium]|nr:V-type ATP synthase subunit I [Bacillota bacterium]
MAVAEMLRVTVVGHVSEEEKIASLLYDLGAVEIATPQPGEDVPLRGRDASVSDLERRISQAKYCIDFLDRFGKPKKSLIQQFSGGKVIVPEDVFTAYSRDEAFVDEIYEKCRSYDERLTELTTRQSQLAGLVATLKPWVSLDMPLSDVRGTPRVGVMLATCPAKEFRQVLDSFPASGIDIHVEVVSEDNKEVRFVAFYMRQDEEVLKAILKEHEVAILPPVDVAGKPADEITRLESEVARCAEEEGRLREEVKGLFVYREKLYSLYDYFNMEKEKYLQRSGWYGTRESFALEGWIPRKELGPLEKRVEQDFESCCVLAREPEEGEMVPVLLDNPAIITPFEAVTEIYSMPHPAAIDPTPLLAPFFFVFFGLCLGDVGYGLGLTAISVLLLRKVKMAGIAKKLFTLLALCGISSAIVGALTGGWLGTLIKVPPLWFNPIENPLLMLGVSFALGIIQIFTGLAVKLYANIRAGKIWDGIFDQGFWMVLLVGLILLLAAPSLGSPLASRVAAFLAGAGAVGLIATQGRSKKNIIVRLGSGVLSLYGVTGYLSDVLSYSRLLALGLASSVIAGVIDTMALMLGGVPVLGWIAAFVLLAGGHVFNLAINVVGSYVHSSRLQYVEFFSKFFEGGGRRFMPFKKRTKYVELVGKGDA